MESILSPYIPEHIRPRLPISVARENGDGKVMPLSARSPFVTQYELEIRNYIRTPAFLESIKDMTQSGVPEERAEALGHS